MNSIEAAGRAMLAAEEGRTLIAREVSALVGRWITGLVARNGRTVNKPSPARASER